MKPRPSAEVLMDPRISEVAKRLPKNQMMNFHRFIHFLSDQRLSAKIDPDPAMPDDCISDIKNLVGKGKGKTYRIAFSHAGEDDFYCQWYRSNSGDLIIMFNLQYPVTVVPED